MATTNTNPVSANEDGRLPGEVTITPGTDRRAGIVVTVGDSMLHACTPEMRHQLFGLQDWDETMHIAAFGQSFEVAMATLRHYLQAYVRHVGVGLLRIEVDRVVPNSEDLPHSDIPYQVAIGGPGAKHTLHINFYGLGTDWQHVFVQINEGDPVEVQTPFDVSTLERYLATHGPNDRAVVAVVRPSTSGRQPGGPNYTVRGIPAPGTTHV